MFNIEPEHFAALGEGILVPDGDMLYITNGHWLIAITACEAHIPLEILKLVAFAENGAFVDWRVLGAKEIFPEEKKFIPVRGGRSFDIYTSGYKYSRVTVEGIRGLMEQNSECLWGTVYRLDQLFTAGAARTKYLRPTDNDKRKFSTEPAAEHYLFDLDGKLLTVGSAYFRTFFEMGFQINCPARTSGPPGLLGLYMKETVPDIFGYLAPTRGTGVNTSKDGRKLYCDAGEASWYTPEEGLEELRDWSSYLPNEKMNATEQVKTNASKSLLLGVSVLRWHGLSDDEINILHQEGRREGLEDRFDILRDELKTMLEEAASSGFDRWRHTGRLEDCEETVKDLEAELGVRSDLAHRLLDQVRDLRGAKTA